MEMTFVDSGKWQAGEKDLTKIIYTAGCEITFVVNFKFNFWNSCQKCL